MSLLINEIYPSPASGEAEWLEIYNLGEEAVNTHGWTVMDASGNKENLMKESNEASASSEMSLAAKSFLVLETGKVSLNNTGDTIYLYSATGVLMDSVTYPSMSKKSYARKVDGVSEWQVTTDATKGVSNTINNSSSEKETVKTVSEEEEVYNYSLAVLEFYPCPETGGAEWLRLQNQGAQAVNLLGFKVKNGASSVSRNLGDVTLNAGASAKIEFTSGVAPNSGGTLLLLDPAGETVAEITYAACSSKSVTFNLIDGKWQEKTIVETSTSETEETVAEDLKVLNNEQTKKWSEGKKFATPRYVYEEKQGINKGETVSGVASSSGIINPDQQMSETSTLPYWQKVGLISLAIVVIIMSLTIIVTMVYEFWQEKNEGKNGDKTKEDDFNLANY